MGILTVNSKEFRNIVIDREELREAAEVFFAAVASFGIQAICYWAAAPGDLGTLSRAFLGF